jgi:hypothetical protein
MNKIENFFEKQNKLVQAFIIWLFILLLFTIIVIKFKILVIFLGGPGFFLGIVNIIAICAAAFYYLKN